MGIRLKDKYLFIQRVKTKQLYGQIYTYIDTYIKFKATFFIKTSNDPIIEEIFAKFQSIRQEFSDTIFFLTL